MSNTQYTQIDNTVVSGSSVANAANDLAQQPFRLGTALAAGALTDAQLLEARDGGSTGLGLLLDNAGGSYDLGDDTNARAATLQSLLGLSVLNDSTLLKFWWSDSPAADALLGDATDTSVIVTLLGAAGTGGTDDKIFESAALATGVSVGQAMVVATATNVTSGAETITFNIVQQGGASAV